MNDDPTAETLRILPFRRGHFELESGHHGDTWLDLELLCLHPAPLRRLATTLAHRLAEHHAELICGPLIEGAFVALMASEALDVPFVYSERLPKDPNAGLFPFPYRLPRGHRPLVANRRVAIVNDVINAGSAVRGTLADLRAAGAIPVAIGALAVLGAPASRLAADNDVPLESLVALDNELWTPAACPLCGQGIPFTHPSNP